MTYSKRRFFMQVSDSASNAMGHFQLIGLPVALAAFPISRRQSKRKGRQKSALNRLPAFHL